MHHATLSHMLCHAHTDVLFMYHHTNVMPVVQMLKPNRNRGISLMLGYARPLPRTDRGISLMPRPLPRPV